MQKVVPISPFRLSSLIRLQNDPKLALQLFLNPNPNDPKTNPQLKPFRYSLLSYDLIISKLGKAKMFPEMEMIIEKLKIDTRVNPEEIIFCNIITYYGRARLPQKALKVFEEMPSFRCHRTIKSVNTLLSSLLICREFNKMREVFSGISNHGTPDACTFNILINSCCVVLDIKGAWDVLDEMRKRWIEPNVVTFGTLINGLCANDDLGKAFNLKRRMEREHKTIKPNSHIYVPLIKGLCKAGDLNKAVNLKNEMVIKKVKLEPAVYSTLISGFCKFGRTDEVHDLLEEMSTIGCKPDTVTYNAMIHGLCQENKFELAFGILNEMEKEGCKPDVISYNLIIGGMCRERKVREASELLEDMPRRKCSPDVVSYRTIFEGLCNVKEFKEAGNVLDEMIFKGYVPHSSSVSKYVDGFVLDQNVELWAHLISLVKRNAVDRYVWRLVTSLVCQSDLADDYQLVNRLVHARSPSVGPRSHVQRASER